MSLRAPRVPQNIKSLIPKQTPTWGTEPVNENSAKATWLGYATIQHDATYVHYLASGHQPMVRLISVSLCSHACYLVELPTPSGAARGARIIFDPVFSNRCSPFQWLGPARYTGMTFAQLTAFLISACTFFSRSPLHNRRGPCSGCHCAFRTSMTSRAHES